MARSLVPPVKRFKRFVRYLLLRASAALLGLLPIRIAAALGAGVGAAASVLARRERARALASVARAFPEKAPSQQRAMVAGMFRHLGRTAAELVCVSQIDQHLEVWVEWPPEDRALLDAALARRKGVVFVSGHVGNWELLARRVALAGYPCQTIAKETSDPRTTALVERFRASGRLKSIWRGRPGAIKEMLRALRQGEILGFLIDQDTNVQSVWVPFFGHLAKTPRAAADLALRTGAAVLLGFCQRQPSGTYLVHLREVTVTSSNVGDPATALTAELTRGIEEAIRRCPEQWVWMHRRWKSPPDPAGEYER